MQGPLSNHDPPIRYHFSHIFSRAICYHATHGIWLFSVESCQSFALAEPRGGVWVYAHVPPHFLKI